MKFTKSKLRQIIREEMQYIFNEDHSDELKDSLGNNFINKYVSDIQNNTPKRGYTTFVIPKNIWTSIERKVKTNIDKAPNFASIDSTGKDIKLIFSS